MPKERQRSPSGTVRASSRLYYAIVVLGWLVGLVSAWFVTWNPSDPSGSIRDFLDFLVSRWMLLTYVVAWLMTGFGIWYIRSARHRAARDTMPSLTMRRQATWLTIVLMAFSLALGTIGYFFIVDLQDSFRDERFSQQRSIARLKAQAVDKWLFERAIDSELLAASLRTLQIDRLPEDRDSGRILGLLLAEFLAGDAERKAITLFAPDGRVLVHLGDGNSPDVETVAAARSAAAGTTRTVQILDVHIEEGKPPRVRMGFIVPIFSDRSPGTPLAVLVAMVDPTTVLFPQVTAWPSHSASSEVVLVRRQGDEVAYITPPRLIEPLPEPLAFRLPLSRKELPAAQAILVGDGVREGLDYRGIPVLTASQRVAGVPWIVIAKTDTDEVMASLNRKVKIIILAISIAILMTAGTVILLWRNQVATHLALRDRQLVEQRALTQHFDQLTRLARDAVLLIDPAGRIVSVNAAAVATYGYSVEEFLALNVRELRPSEEFAHFDMRWPLTSDPRGVLFEAVNRRKDGTTFPAELSVAGIEIEGQVYRQAFIRDISRRKALEEEIARLSRVKAALLGATSVLLRARSEAEVLQEMCEVLVQLGGYSLAHISAPNHDAGMTVRFLAVAGIDNGYLAQAAITWGEGPRSKGPTGTVLRTGEIRVNQDFLDDPTVAPWREAAVKRGFRSTIGLPLKVSGKVVAALTLYSSLPHAFNMEEVTLLTALADDISFKVSLLREGGGPGAAASPEA